MRVMMAEGIRFPDSVSSRFFLGDWPAQWVHVAGDQAPPFVAVYRLRFELPEPQTARIHVSADQRYELLLDGQRIGRGPERGDKQHWFYESYDLSLSAGPHTLVARTWLLDQEAMQAPNAQISLRHGFLLAAEGPMLDRLSTGRAPWEAKKLGGYTFHSPPTDQASHFAGGTLTLDGRAFDWAWPTGGGEGWTAVVPSQVARDRINRWGESGRIPRLHPARLPAMIENTLHLGTVRTIDAPASVDAEQLRQLPYQAVDPALRAELDAWQAMLRGEGSLTVPAHARRRVLVDLENYYCAYPQITCSGGRDATIRMNWAESLFLHPPRPIGPSNAKGHRDQWEGKFFRGRGHTFIADGGPQRTFDTLWWECGRYVEVVIETASEPLTIDALVFRETRYPLTMEGRVNLSDERFNAAVPIMWRTLQMCSHETYMDCPYYEQLMYAGDTRLEILTTYLMTADDRLPRKALMLFGVSHSSDGLTHARYPSHVEQIIPQFALFFVAMLYDFALWRGDRAFVLRFMPRARQVLETFIGQMDESGLVHWPEGWNWIDWTEGWSNGNPLPDPTAPNGINQWQFVYVLGLAAELERWLEEPDLAQRLERIRLKAAGRAMALFWDEPRGLFATSVDKSGFSEHAQCYAVLSGLLDPARQQRVIDSLLSAPDLGRATIYFQHYLFEVLRLAGRTDALLERMQLWYDLPAEGLRTCLEQPEPSRSDCHAWGAHPIYHACASIAGVRPAGLGADQVIVRPQLGPLEFADVELFIAQGRVCASLRRTGSGLGGSIELPANVTGVLHHAGQEIPLRPGVNRIDR